MAPITKIECEVTTANESGASTDGYPYLGIGGREFRLDTSDDDFQQNAKFRYVFGEDANVLFPERNDPRDDFPLDTNRLDGFPVYIRFDPENASDHWRPRLVIVLVYEAGDSLRAAYVSRLRKGIWLGRTSGKILHLVRFQGFGNERILSEQQLAALTA